MSFFSSLGGLAIAVPGELRAYERAYNEFGGGVSWKELFQPTIDLCRQGFVISTAQGAAIQRIKDQILNDTTLKFLFN